MEKSDKQIIQQNIHNTGNRNKIHRTFRISQSAENRTDHIIRRNKRNPEKTDCQISCCPGNSLRRRRHHRNNWLYKKQKQNRQHQRNPHKQSHRISHKHRSPFLIARPNRLSNRNRGSHRQPNDHHRQHMHHLAPDRNRRRTGNPIKLPHNKKIRHPIKRLQKIRQKIRQRKINHIPKNTPRSKIPFHKITTPLQSLP